MILFAVSALALIFGLREIFREGLPQGKLGRELSRTVQVKNLIQDLEDQLSSGVLPRSERWQALQELPEPWSPHLSDSVLQLRQRGAALLPTLKRLSQLAASHERSLVESRAKSAQSWGQAVLCLALVPIFSAVLYESLPGVADAGLQWLGLTAVGLVLGLGAAFWIVNLSEAARWGGLPAEKREWVLPILCFGERILALIQGGSAADEAWTGSLNALPAELQREWKGSIFAVGERGSAAAGSNTATGVRAASFADSLHGVGPQLKRAIHASLLEGRPCFERIQLVMEGFQIEMRAHQERELQLLPTKAMKPLFLCIAPAIFILLAGGLMLSFQSVKF